jgi:hypothetical protein
MTFIAQGMNFDGCALAAVASVTNLSYEDARCKLIRKNFDPNNGMVIVSILSCLKKLGKEVSRSILIPKNNRNEYWIESFLKEQDGDVILCSDNGDRTFHCIVWNNKAQCFWDPSDYGEFYLSCPQDVYRIIIVK